MDGWSVGDWHIPTVLAVIAWAASGLAVLGYTVNAYKATSSGSGLDVLNANPPGVSTAPATAAGTAALGKLDTTIAGTLGGFKQTSPDAPHNRRQHTH